MNHHNRAVQNQELTTAGVAEHLVNEALTKLSRDVIPSEAYVSGGKEAVKEVIELLHRSSHSIDREFISGSEGKKTAIMDTDFDCVLFLNGRYPPFTRVLTDFERILIRHPQIHGLHKTRSSIQFKYRGYDIDLLPATNYHYDGIKKREEIRKSNLPSYNHPPLPLLNLPLNNHLPLPILNLNLPLATTSCPSSSGLGSTPIQLSSHPTADLHHLPPPLLKSNPAGTRQAWQAFDTYKAIKLNPKKASLHSSSLCEIQLHFMRSQSPLVHDLVRLCKFWNKSLIITTYISGRSTLIELIAVFAGQLAESRTQATNEGQTLLKGFKIFLECMARFNQLEIEFAFDPLAPLGTKIRKWNFKVGSSIKHRPCVMEPANPYNNIAQGVGDQGIQFQKYAAVTLKRLGQTLAQSRHYVPNLSNLFSPQPDVVPYHDNHEKGMFQNQLSIVPQVRAFKSADATVSIPLGMTMEILEQGDYGQTERMMKNLMNMFGVVAVAFVSSYKVRGLLEEECEVLGEIQHALEKRIATCVARQVVEGETLQDELDEKDDVATIKIPLKVKDGMLLLKIHFQEVEEFEDVDEEEDSDGSD